MKYHESFLERAAKKSTHPKLGSFGRIWHTFSMKKEETNKKK